MVRAPPPFNTTDIRKCELFKERLDSKGYSMHDVEYSAEDGSNIDNTASAHESIFGKLGKRAATCHIHGNNQMVDKALSTYGKIGSVWATAFEVELNRREVARTDIPVNLASCNAKPNERIEYVTAFESMPASCKLQTIHSHNMKDTNAAFHIHLKCKDDTDEGFNATLNWLQRLIDNASLVSRAMCSSDTPISPDVKISNVARFEECLQNCTKPRSSKRTRQEMLMF